jgi:SWIM zinc finger
MSAHNLANNPSLRSFFQQLDALAIQQQLGRDIYHKGLHYYENDAVEELDVADANTIVATVYGSFEYEVKIFARSGSVEAKCSCPYGREWGGMCKHIAAVLIKAVEEEFWKVIPDAEETAAPAPAAEKGTSSRADIFENWLASLSIGELRQTVRKLASPAFQEEIKIRYGSTDDREQVFLDTKKKIGKLLNRLGSYDGGEYFNEKITPLIEKLRGVWADKPEEVKDLFLQIIEAIDEAQQEGSMPGEYGEYDEYSYDGSELMGYLTEFLKELPDELRLACLPVFWEAIGEEDYDSFSVFFSMAPEYLKPGDWSALKQYFADSELLANTGFAQHAHDIFEAAMTPEEKGEWLENLAWRSNKFVVPLALFYEKEKGDVKKAAKTLAKTIEKLLAQENYYYGAGEITKQILEERIRLAQMLKEPLEELCEQYVELLPLAESLWRVLPLSPDQKEPLEGLLQQKSIAQYLVHLETEKRLDEVVGIIESEKKEFSYGPSFGFSSGFSRYDFYVRHKKEMPEKALACFRERLNGQLPYTGNNHYREVVDILKNMKPLLPAEEMNTLVRNIRTKYSRRRNLTAMLDGEFKR